VADAADFSALSLGGTSVTIIDSSGAALPAPLLSVSPGEVRYVAPTALAPGPAKVIVKTPDGSIRTGAVTVVDVYPAVLAARIVRTGGGTALELDATGIRHAVAAHMKVTVGGVDVPVTYAGPQGLSAGLDRVEVPLPAAVAGSGEIPVVLMVSGRQSNRVRVTSR
jgi:hypothetical protein